MLAPDLLGYGGSSKPTSAENYKAKSMAGEIIEILESENIQRVHAVSHDMGSILLSRLVNYFPERFSSTTFLSVPYSKPGETFDLDKINAMTKQLLGKERFGYIAFFIQDDAGSILDRYVCLPPVICYMDSDGVINTCPGRFLFHPLLSERLGSLD